MTKKNISSIFDANIGIIPSPISATVTEHKALTIDYGTKVWACNDDACISAQYLIDYCKKYLGITLCLTEEKCEALIFIEIEKGENVEYSLVVNEQGISIKGKCNPAAAFYGVLTLIQMLPTRPGDVPAIPFVEIHDAPRFAYRGMLLDVVRHFFPIEFVKQFIDWLALHKMNVFHWHLTDDQGWRIEIKSHPELTERGSYRAGERKGFYPGEYCEIPYRAYYTQEEIKEVIDYAAKRFVTVVPEIDVPGHCTAVLAAHPEFSTEPQSEKKTAETWCVYNRHNNVLAPTKEVFDFLTDVFTEVCELFPSEYIHSGGDECAPKWWAECEMAQKFMKENNLATAHDLQTYFMHHVQKIVNGYGKTIIGWDGGSEGMHADGSIIESWLLHHPKKELPLNTTHKWIYASERYVYFICHEVASQTDLAQEYEWNLSVKDVYDAPLCPQNAPANVISNLQGVEGCLWAECVPDCRVAEFRAFPRVAALAEKAWRGEACDNWLNFASRLKKQLHRYDLWRIRYNPIIESSLE